LKAHTLGRGLPTWTEGVPPLFYVLKSFEDVYCMVCVCVCVCACACAQVQMRRSFRRCLVNSKQMLCSTTPKCGPFLPSFAPLAAIARGPPLHNSKHGKPDNLNKPPPNVDRHSNQVPPGSTAEDFEGVHLLLFLAQNYRPQAMNEGRAQVGRLVFKVCLCYLLFCGSVVADSVSGSFVREKAHD